MLTNTVGYRIVSRNKSVDTVQHGRMVALYVIGSTMTSTLPGISIAGNMPLATLFTPALDVEYLYYGKPITFDIIPTTPTGIPTPAIITRAALQLSKIPFTVVDVGSFIPPKTPLISLPSKCIGRSIDKEDALPSKTSEQLFGNARYVGQTLGSIADVVLLGESIPAGTTTAMAILSALGFNGYSLISSSMKFNPLNLKKSVVSKALQRLKEKEIKDPLEINDVVGDPVHISVAGIALGVLDAGSTVMLAGGTQMLAVLALMKSLEPSFSQDRVIHATTRWVYLDRGREILEFIESTVPNVALIYSELDFSNAPFEGLKAYEDGFVKEGVGAGGTAFAALARGVSIDELTNHIFNEYRRITHR